MSEPTANPAAPALNTRRQALLEIIVSDYIETAAPVSSQQLARRYEFRVSPATIRNDMAGTGGDGLYLPSAHVGGRRPVRPRLPLLRGARRTAATASPATSRSTCATPSTSTRPTRRRGRAARPACSPAPSTTSPIATTVKRPVARVKQMQIVHLHDREALLVVVMQDAQLRQRIIHLDSDTTQDDLTLAASQLNRLAGGDERRRTAHALGLRRPHRTHRLRRAR